VFSILLTVYRQETIQESFELVHGQSNPTNLIHHPSGVIIDEGTRIQFSQVLKLFISKTIGLMQHGTN
jgi:hypothetical protein